MKLPQLALCFLILPLNGVAFAQSWPPWADDIFSRSPTSRFDRQSPRDDPRDRPPSPSVQDGGARPEINPQPPPVVGFAYNYPPNSIVIDTGARRLYFVLDGNQAYAYPISVGREGFNWTGNETVSRKQSWPDWHPPAEMRERDPNLPEKMTGGERNPLGATALYLGNTLYRIHGTNDVKSIGRAQSSGCFRMLNAAVLHLASITEIGTPVAVVPSLQVRPEMVGASAPADPPAFRRPPQPWVEERLPDYRSLRQHTFEQPSMERSR